jgi:dGTPase
MNNNIWIERKEVVNSRVEYNQYERDAARILHSSAFRRLQNKMQVQFIGDSDYYRTRLTHSLEVMQIGRGILYHLNNINKKEEVKEILPPVHLMEAICLAHDLGHPPFGHAGEKALHKKMEEFGGFEGNAQTFRIITRLGEFSKSSGFNLTRRATLGVVKYPVFYETVRNKKYSEKPPKCLYSSEKDIFNWLLEPFSKKDIILFQSNEINEGKHNKSLYKTLDTSIMEKADDIAYAFHDFEDAIKLNIINSQFWDNVILIELKKYINFINEHIDVKEHTNKSFIDFAKERLFSNENKDSKLIFSKFINFFITAIEINENKNFESPLLKYNAVFKDSNYDNILEIIKEKIIYKQVIKRTENTQLEYKGTKVISNL